MHSINQKTELTVYVVGFDIGKGMVSKQTNEVETSERYKAGQR